MSAGTTLVGAERLSQRVSRALWPIDTVTGIGGRAVLGVSLSVRDITAVRSLSGYYIFTDLPVGTYSVLIQGIGADSGKYLNQNVEVEFPADEASRRTPVHVRLLPTPGYPFSSLATLIRGFVEFRSEPAGGAAIECNVDDRTTYSATDEGGEFVIALPPAAIDSIAQVSVRFRQFSTVFSMPIKLGRTHNARVIHLP